MESKRERESGQLDAMRSGWSVGVAVPARLSDHCRHPFDVPCHRNQRPLASHRGQPARQELDLITRLMRLLTRQGLLIEEAGMSYLAEPDADDADRGLTALQAASCT
jgi:hypothetical protein